MPYDPKNLKITGVDGCDGGINIHWVDVAPAGKFGGFGTVMIWVDDQGQLRIDNEHMSEEFNRALFDQLLAQAKRR